MTGHDTDLLAPTGKTWPPTIIGGMGLGATPLPSSYLRSGVKLAYAILTCTSRSRHSPPPLKQDTRTCPPPNR